MRRPYAPVQKVGSVFKRRIGAGTGNRTRVFSLEGCCSTIELHPHERSDSTSRPALQRGRTGRQKSFCKEKGSGGRGRTRTYEGIARGFTVPPLCRSGHSPTRPSHCMQCFEWRAIHRLRKSPVGGRGDFLTALMVAARPPVNIKKELVPFYDAATSSDAREAPCAPCGVA